MKALYATFVIGFLVALLIPFGWDLFRVLYPIGCDPASLCLRGPQPAQALCGGNACTSLTCRVISTAYPGLAQWQCLLHALHVNRAALSSQGGQCLLRPYPAIPREILAGLFGNTVIIFQSICVFTYCAEDLNDLQGKDRYPYPVGYQAVRNHAGHIYKMEIREGTKGPAFVVISEEGISCLGETPTIAWEKIQKKKNMRVQKWHRNQFSRVDGAELLKAGIGILEGQQGRHSVLKFTQQCIPQLIVQLNLSWPQQCFCSPASRLSTGFSV
eukprot:Gb_02594 [translate_table: standard]